jgi:5-methylcytosine-specific restriction protein B
VTPESSDTPLRRPLLLRTLFEVLRRATDPQPPGSVLQQVAELVSLTPQEASKNASGIERFSTFLRFASSWASTVGWMSKRGGWSLTDAGVEALETVADDEALHRELTKRYREVRKRKKTSSGDSRWATVAEALSLVEAGSWTAYGDLAEVVDVPPQVVGQFMANNEVPNPHRVLQGNGRVAPEFRWSDPNRRDDPRELLEREGVEFDTQGRASQAQRLRSEDLADLLRDVGIGEVGGRRAWLVRGSSVNGYNLVPDWLAEGFVSLAASNLRSVEHGLDRTEIKAIVDEDYSHKSYAARKEKVVEFHAFLTRMQTGDLVVTTSGGKVYLGVATGDAEWIDSPDKRSNLRRSVEWRSADAPLQFADLPTPLPAKLSSQSDVVDLTEELAILERLLGEGVAPAEEVKPVAELVLRDADHALADKLLVDKTWLQEVIDLLRGRRQIIFYGPPGTGKTYVAQHIARHLTEPNAVKLVQFHASYSYEDFFEGYRPVPGEDGKVGFELKPGPFRRIVEAARQDPSTPYVLIIDEINRGNLAKVFGELYFLLEYRDQSIGLLYSAGEEDDFTLPENVFLIGTMNTADRSIALVDTAMRRRFAFVSLHPSEEPVRGLLARWLDQNGYGAEAAHLLAELNNRVADHDYAIGPSYLMRPEAHTEGGLELIWRTSMMPLLEELHYGEGIDLEARYGLAALRKAVAPMVAEPAADEGDAEPAEP